MKGWYPGVKFKTYNRWSIKDVNLLRDKATEWTMGMAAVYLGVPLYCVKNACHRYRIKMLRTNVKRFFKITSL